MGRRSRKRAASGASRPPEPARSQETPSSPSSRRRTRSPERPPAPWGKFPLVELCILLALVLGVAGLFTGGRQGFAMLGAAAALGSLAGLELSIREHFSGFRSHTMLLAATVAVVALAIAFFAGAPREVTLVAGVVIFAAGVYWFREQFKRRSGGIGFKVR